MANKRSFLLGIAFMLLMLSVQVYGQGAFDCISAQLICAPQYQEADNFSTSAGANLDEIKDGETCMFDRDERGILWYTFKVNNTGDFGFLITPSNPNDDYDWVLFDLTNASCEDLATDPAALMVSCNASGSEPGGNCVGTTGMDINARYDIQGGGCDVDPPSIDAGFSTLNAFVPVVQGNTYVLAVQNWTFIDEGRSEGYSIDFSASINTGIIDTEAPVITSVVGGPSICDNEPIVISLNENISCTAANSITATLTGPDGSVIQGQVFAADCLRGATGVKELVLTADFRGATAGDYVVTLNDTPSNQDGLRDGCDNIIELPISFDVFLTPDVSLNVNIRNRTPRNDVCEGDVVVLRAEESFDFLGTNHLYEWTRPDGTTFIGRDMNATRPGTYTVNVLQNGARAQPGCRRGTATYTIEGGVLIDLGPDRSGICEGEGQTLTAQAGGTNYTWSTGQSGNNLREITVTESGTYTVSVETDCGDVIDNITIEYDEIPYTVNQTNFSICPNESVMIGGADIGNGTTYSWSNGANTPTTSVSTPGTYIVTVRQGSCSTQRTINVAGSAVPDLNITGPTNVCPGVLANLAANDLNNTGATFSWNTGRSGQILSGVGEGTYTVTAVSSQGCETTDMITISEHVVVPATINGNTNFTGERCATAGPINLTASSGEEYLWSNGSTDRNIMVSNGPLSVVVTDSNNCESTANATVTEIAQPAIALPNSADANCAPDRQSYTINVNISNANQVQTAGGLGTVTDNGNGTYTISDIPDGQEVIVIARNAQGCETTAPAFAAPACGCPTIAPPSVGNNITICQGSPIPALSANTTVSDAVIRWFDSPSATTPIFTGNSFVQTTAGTYYAETYNTNSDCASTRIPVILTINSLPTANITGDNEVCPAGATNTTLSASLTGGGATAFQWAGNGISNPTNPSVTVGAGTYSVEVTDNNGCKAIDNITIALRSVAQASIGGDMAVCAGETTTLSASAGQSYNWSVNNETGATVTVGQGPYMVTVTDTNGCESEASTTVTENATPSITIPNMGTCAGDRQTYSVQVNTEAGNTITPTSGNVTGGGGFFTVNNITTGENIIVIVRTPDGCEDTRSITAPSCECPALNAPASNVGATQTICSDEAIPALIMNTAGLGADEVIRWYDTDSGGAPLATGASFIPARAGTYFAEIHDEVSNCQSPRTSVRLVINATPTATIAGSSQVCPDGTTQLTANLQGGGASRFQWSNGSTSPSITVGQGDYTVVVEDGNGCSDESAMVSITEFNVTQANITGDLAVCPGEMTSLRTTGGASYAWSNGGTGDNVNVGSGMYSVVVTDANGCESTDNVNVTQNVAPTVTIPSAGNCAGDRQTYSVQVNTEAGNTITPTSGNVTGGGGFFTVRDVPAGTNIMVTISTPEGCTETRSIDAPDCNCPSIAAPASNNDVEVCADEAIPALSVSVASLDTDEEIRWYNVDSGGTELATGANFTPAQAGTYFAEVYNSLSNCQSPRTAVRLIINAVPTAIITGDTQVCPSGETQINANLQGGGASSFQWSATANGSNSPNVTVGQGMYSAVVTDANGCSDEASFTITEFNVAQAEITGNLAVCPGEMTNLRTTGGTNYAWSNGGTGDNINVGPGNYDIVVTDANGCESMASVSVTGNAAPNITLPNTAACSGDRQTYSVQVNTDADNTINPTSGTVTGGGGFFTVRDVPAGTGITVTVTTPEGCEDTRTITAPDCSCPALAAPQSTGNIEICENEAIPALGVSVGSLDADEEIRWYDVDSGGTAIATGTSFIPTRAGTYFAEVYNTLSNCESQRTTVSLTINTLPEAAITGAAQVCPGEQSDLTANLQGGGADRFQWSADANSSNSPMVNVGEGVYSVVVTDANGCSDEASITITEFSVTQAEIIGESSVCPDETTTLGTTNGTSYAWSNGGTGDNINVGTGTYSVVVTDSNGCESEASTTITEDALPVITLPSTAACDDDLVNYSVRINIAADDVLTVNGGIGTVTGGGGFLTIRDIPAAQNITVSVQNVAGCISERVITAPDCSCPALAAPQSTGDIAICADETIPELTVSPAGVDSESEIRWYSGASGGAAIATGLGFTPTAAGTYFAEVYNTVSNCQSQRTEIRLVINAVPTANIVGASDVCPGLTTELTANLSAGTVQSYQWSASANSSLSRAVEVNAGTYSVIVTDENGCVAQAMKEISEFDVAQAEITGDDSVCPDGTTVLTASAGTSYNWSNFGTGADVTVGVGSYMVTVTDANGCDSEASLAVTQDALPTVTLVDGLLNCADDLESYNFRINTNSDNIVTSSLGTVGGGGGFFNVSGVPKDVPVVVTITNPNTGCVVTQTFDAPDCSCPQFAAPMSMGDMEVCADATIPALSVSGAGINSESEIRWYDSPTSITPIATGLDFTPTQGGSYFAEIFNTVSACTSPRTEVRLVINDLPTANIAGTNNVCPGLDTELSATLSSGTASQFAWSASANNAASPSVTVGAGSYSVTVTDENGCVAETSFDISEFSVAQASIDGDLTVCPDGNGTSTTILTASTGADYNWSNFGTGADVTVGAGTYTVTVTDNNNCESIANASVSEDAIPMLELVDGLLDCAQDLTSYGFQINTEAGNNLSVSLGNATGSAGFFTVSDVIADVPVTITVSNPNTGCVSEQSFDAPDCSCPQVAAPQSMGNVEVCADAVIPELSVSGAGVDEESEVRWYDTPTDGIAIGTGLNFMPTRAGAYYAEIFNATTNCQSPRTEVILTINELPTANIAGASSVCPSEETELIASLLSGSATNFQWSNNGNGPSVTVGVGSYSVTVTDANGCTAETNRDIAEFEVTEASISGNTTVCPDETTTLTASAGASYEWNNFNTSNTVTVGIGTASVVVTDSNGCQSEANIEVTENTVPTITLVDGLLACSDDRETYSFQITTEADNDLTTSLGTASGSNGSFTVDGVLKDTPVSVTLTNTVTGCVSTQQFNAPDCSCPQVSAPPSMGDMEVCEGLDIPALSVDASGIDSESEVRWYESATSTAAIATGASFMPTAGGSYFAEIINTVSSCTSARTEVRLTINSTPTGNIEGASSVCPSETTELTASLTSGTVQSIMWSSSAASANTATVEVVAGVYSVSITDANGCETVESKVIEELPAAVAMINGDNTVCPGETTELTASGGVTFAWSDFSQSAVVSLGVGDHSVTVTDANGCTDITNIEVTEDALPSIMLVDGLLNCSGDLETYNFQISTETDNEVMASLGVVNGTAGTFTVTDVTKDTPVTITIINPSTGCVDTQTFQSPDCNCETVAAPSSDGDVAICSDATIPALMVSDAGLDADSEIRWYNSATSNAVVATGASFTPNAAGQYFAEIFNTVTGCSSTRQTVTLTIRDAVSVSINGPAAVCAGPAVLTELSVNFEGGIADTYQWSANTNNAGTPTVIVDAGEYTVTVTDTNGCTAEASISVGVLDQTPVEITGETAVCPGETTTLTAINGATFTWDDGTQNSSIEAAAGTYTVLAVDANGCPSEASITIDENTAPSLTLSSSAACSSDLLSYGLEITTEDGNIVTADIGTVTMTGGIASITDIAPETPVAVTVTDASGCVATQVFQAPNCDCPSFAVVTTSGDAAICDGDAIPAFTASSDDLVDDRVLRWFDADIDGNELARGTEFTPSAAGTYFVEILEESSNCTSARVPVTLTVNTLPDAMISGTMDICPDATTTITASGGMTYAWDNSEITESIDVTAGDYNVMVTDANGCSANANISINEFVVTEATITGDTDVCPDEMTTLTVSEGVNFLWDTGDRTQTVEVGRGMYNVLVEDANGCESSAMVEVVQNTPPSLTLSTSAACSSDLLSYGLEITTEDGNMVTTDVGTVTMTAGIVSITDIATETPVMVTVTNPTTGCVTMQAFQAPNCDCPSFAVITTSGDAAICDGDAIPAFTASSDDLIDDRVLRWFDADIDGNELARGTEFTPSAAGTYFVEILEESSNCTSARIPVTLTVNTLPNAAINGATDICPDVTTTITASGGTTYTWDNSETTESIDVNAGDYNVMVTDANGCSASASISINAFTVSPASITGDLGVCADETTTLMASTGTSFQWGTGEATESVEVGVGSYSVIVTDANGCESTATADVLEDAPPSFNVAQQANCSSDLTTYSVQLQTEAGNTLTATTGTLNDLGNGLWEVSGVDATTGVVVTISNPSTGCMVDAPFEAPNCNCPTLVAPTSDGDAVICTGDVIPALSVTNSDASLTVNWYDAAAGGNLVATGASFTPSAAGTYYAEVEEAASACTSLRTELTLTVNSLPDVNIAASAEGACGNDSVTLTASGADNYTWSNGDTTTSIDITPGTYTLTGMDANGCENTANVNIVAFPTPTVSVDAPEFICGEEFDIVTANGGDTYLWSTGETNASVQIGEGTYTITATNAEGCTDELEFSISAVTQASADLGTDQILCSNETLQLSPGTFPAGSMMFEWSNGSTSETLEVIESGQYRVSVTDMCDGEAIASVNVDIIEAIDQDLLEIALGQDTTNCPGVVNFDIGNADLGNTGDISFRWQDGSTRDRFSTTEEGTVTLTATNECGDVSAEVAIEACKECKFYTPNAFSPDGKGDPVNESFKIFSNCEAEITNFQMKIFDRWGGLVFETISMDESWDGMFNGERPVSDAFVWIATYDIVDRYGNLRSRADSGEFTMKE